MPAVAFSAVHIRHLARMSTGRGAFVPTSAIGGPKDGVRLRATRLKPGCLRHGSRRRGPLEVGAEWFKRSS